MVYLVRTVCHIYAYECNGLYADYILRGELSDGTVLQYILTNKRNAKGFLEWFFALHFNLIRIRNSIFDVLKDH